MTKANWKWTKTQGHKKYNKKTGMKDANTQNIFK